MKINSATPTRAALLIASILAALVANPSSAQTPTKLRIRAVANDAKVIGSGVGGARITVRDARTGEVLAEGVQEGSTGNTRAIVVDPIERGSTVFDFDGTAVFETVLDLTEPTAVEVTAEGPLATPHAIQTSSKTVLMLPGEHVLGEGLILILNGFTVELQAPSSTSAENSFEVRARVTMLCGCPTEPGGLWDSNEIEVRALLVQDGHAVAEAALAFSGETSIYVGQLRAPSTGAFTLRVVAVDTGKANIGMVERALTVR